MEFSPNKFGNEKDLIDFLNQKAIQYETPEYLNSDPLGLVHQFKDKKDIEISGLIIALIAWGNRKSIIKSGENLLKIMDYRPYDFIMDYENIRQLPKFVHRTFNTIDLDFMIRGLKSIYQKGDLEDAFSKHDYHKGIYGRISNFRSTILNVSHEKRSEKHIANPLTNSSCKRLNMFLRWMARSSEKGVDLGVWKTIDPSELYIPLDVHSGRNARLFGLLKRKQNDWKALEELMVNLKRFDSRDPVKYDFALFGLGVFENF